MYVRGDVLKGEFNFTIFIGLQSYTWEFLGFSYLLIFSISFGFGCFSLMSEQGSLKFLNIVSNFWYFDRIWDLLNFHISPGSMLNIA